MDVGNKSPFPGATRRERQMAADIAMKLGLPTITGTWFFVDGKDGSDTNNGKSPTRAVKTYDTAYGLCTDAYGDGICILSRSTSSSSYSATIAAAIAWTKSGITTYGVCAGGPYNGRARISFTAATTDVYMLYVTGINNRWENVNFVNENDLSAAEITTVKLHGDRNTFINCCFIATPATSSLYKSDFWLNDAHENYFFNCNFGAASHPQGDNAGCHIYMDGANGNAQNIFDHCTSVAQVTAGTAFGFLKGGATTALNGTIIFRDCVFTVWQANTGLTAMTSWYIGSNQNTGAIDLFCCGSFGYAKWDSAGTGNVLVCNLNGATAEIAAAGIAIAAS
jgi:hypothetical protein